MAKQKKTPTKSSSAKKVTPAKGPSKAKASSTASPRGAKKPSAKPAAGKAAPAKPAKKVAAAKPTAKKAAPKQAHKAPAAPATRARVQAAPRKPGAKVQAAGKKIAASKPKPAAGKAGKIVASPQGRPANGAAAKAAQNKRAEPKAALAGRPKAARNGDDARSGDEKKAAGAKGKVSAKNLIKDKTSAAKKKGAGKPKTIRPIAFSLDEALAIAKTKETKPQETKPKAGAAGAQQEGSRSSAGRKELPADAKVKQENRVLGAASIADILGYSPSGGPKKPAEAEQIPPKFSRYYKLLVELRDHVISGLDLHTKDTLKRSSKDDAGDLSAYGQHMADAGTDTFDRDFALSLVSSEQDALNEIEDAIRRIRTGTYGICEITGKPIKKERLLAVPFARFSVEGQVEYEKTHRKSAFRGGGVFSEGDEAVQFLEDEGDE